MRYGNNMALFSSPILFTERYSLNLSYVELNHPMKQTLLGLSTMSSSLQLWKPHQDLKIEHHAILIMNNTITA